MTASLREEKTETKEKYQEETEGAKSVMSFNQCHQEAETDKHLRRRLRRNIACRASVPSSEPLKPTVQVSLAVSLSIHSILLW